MRYYDITVEPIAGGTQSANYSSENADGSFNARALQVEFDIPVNNFAAPAGLGIIKIRGVSFQNISQPNYLVGRTITVRGGMLKGLPLAKPQQRGILMQGRVYQAFGNWQGTDVSLDIIISPLVGSTSTPVNLAGKWKKGQSLQEFLTLLLQQAYGSATPVTGTLASNLTAAQDYDVAFPDVPQLATWALQQSLTVNNENANVESSYLGVQIAQRDNGFYLYDGTVNESAPLIAFTDMIGNGTWLGFQQIQIKTVLRADLAVGNTFTLPKGSNLVAVVNSFSQYRQNVSFQNTFRIIRLRHVGNSRQADADSWCTIIDAVLLNQQIADEQVN